MTRITNYITEAFADVPRTNNAMELQEELISNLTEKYNDQLSLGKTEDEAYSAVISSIGDLSELTEGLKARHVLSPESPEERKKSARHIAIAVMLFILSPAALILTANLFDQGVIGLVIMFAFIAAGVGLLIYNSASKPSYLKENESLIEEFKEFKAAKTKIGMHDSLIGGSLDDRGGHLLFLQLHLQDLGLLLDHLHHRRCRPNLLEALEAVP